MKNLLVPYKSQWDNDAGKTNNDCGPTSIAMVLNYYGEQLTTDTVFEATGAGQGLIGWEQLIQAITSFGYVAHLERNGTRQRIRELIDQDIPPIPLVHYGSLKSTQDKKFKGGHFFVVVGYREDGYFVNDSNFKGTLRQDGDHHFYTKEELEQAWADSVKDGNQPNSLLWIERKSPNPDIGELGKCQDRVGYLERTLADTQRDAKEWKKALDALEDRYKELTNQHEGVKESNKQWNSFLDSVWELLNPALLPSDKSTQSVMGEIKNLIKQEDQLQEELEKVKGWQGRYASLFEKVALIAHYTGDDEKSLLRALHEGLSSTNTTENENNEPELLKQSFWGWLLSVFKRR